MGGRVRYACEWTSVGIGVAAQRNIRALIDHPDVDTAVAPGEDTISLAWEPLVAESYGRTRAADSSGAAAWLRALRRPRVDGEVLVQHSVPGAWREVADSLRPAHRIGCAVWELDDVPRIWHSQMSDVDEFWVPTEWNREAFERSFRRPVHVVPHVVTDVVPTRPPIDVPEGVAVVSCVSAWDWRKRPDRAVEAFCHAFTGRDPVVLVVKTTPWHVGWPGGLVDVAELIHRITQRFPDPPTVHYSTAEWSEGQMAGLAQRSICTLSLTASEGWGLGTFDAAAMGVPAIITGYGGQIEYLGVDYPGLIPYRRVPTSHSDRTLFEAGTEWAHADMDAAVDMLRAVVDGSATALVERSAELAVELRRRYSAVAVGDRMVGNLRGSLDRSVEATNSADPGTSARRPTTGVVPRASSSSPRPPEVVVMSTIVNAAHRVVGFVDGILGLDHPTESLRVAVLVSDSDDVGVDDVRREFERLRAAGIESSVHRRDVDVLGISGSTQRGTAIDTERRIERARSRNHLLSRELGDAEWALWIDVDVVEFPSDIIARLLDVGGDVVQPHCRDADGARGSDRDAWTDRGIHHLHDYAGHGVVELHSVGAGMLLVRADRHRDGLVWPVRREPVGRVETRPVGTRPDGLVGTNGEIGGGVSDGFARRACEMGIACWGLPDLIIRRG